MRLLLLQTADGKWYNSPTFAALVLEVAADVLSRPPTPRLPWMGELCRLLCGCARCECMLTPQHTAVNGWTHLHVVVCCTSWACRAATLPADLAGVAWTTAIGVAVVELTFAGNEGLWTLAIRKSRLWLSTTLKAYGLAVASDEVVAVARDVVASAARK
jgi:hypothetical protein